MGNPAYYRLPLNFRSNTVSGERIRRICVGGAERGVSDAVDLVYDMSQVEVPKESMRLAESGRKVKRDMADQRGPRHVVGHVIYGGPGVPYAARIHEEITWNFKTPGTKAQYLADPLKTVTPLLGALVAQRVHNALAARLPRR